MYSITNLWKRPDPDRASQNYPKLLRDHPGITHSQPELTIASQEPIEISYKRGFQRKIEFLFIVISTFLNFLSFLI